MFRNDYSLLADERILKDLLEYQQQSNVGYGLDDHSKTAALKICDFFGSPRADVHFLVGGTIANMTVLSFLLKPYQAVIAASSAHINVHETGAIEASGHKILTDNAVDGKLTVDGVERIMAEHTDEHMVLPAVIYISQSTETGTIYSLEELRDLRHIADKYGLKIFIDGARLAVALEAAKMSPKDFAAYADVFTVGATKNGALFGEAVVFTDPEISKDFRYHIKNRGAMLAKGFAVGIQMERLFTDGLYLELANTANRTARKVKAGLTKLGIRLTDSPTNQQFAVFTSKQAQCVTERLGCEVWSRDGDNITVRFVTSFATTDEEVDQALLFIKDLLK